MTTTTEIEYEADGRTMVGRLALPDGESRHPAVLIAHEGPGLDDHQRSRADQLAELGYVAFALDYQGGGKSVPDREAMMARLDDLWRDPERTRSLARAAWTSFSRSLVRTPHRSPRSVTASAATWSWNWPGPAPPSRSWSGSTRGWRPLGRWIRAISPARCSCASAPRTRWSRSGSG